MQQFHITLDIQKVHCKIYTISLQDHPFIRDTVCGNHKLKV